MADALTLGRDVRKISNSEVATWLNCKRKYYYEFDLNLEPNQVGTALGRGILLHTVLACYYQALKDGINHPRAVILARSELQKWLSKNDFAMEVVMEVDKLTTSYFDFYQGDPDWEILEVEKSYDLPITEDYTYSLRLDLLVRLRSNGSTRLVDHKTAYNFWTESDLNLNAQFPKYIGSLRGNGISVDGVILNQIRTRSIKNPTMDQLYKRVYYKPSLAKIKNAMQEQIIASDEIHHHRLLPLEVREQKSLRILNKKVCEWCDAEPLCSSEYDGGDITYLVANDYRKRQYGYNPEEVTDLL